MKRIFALGLVLVAATGYAEIPQYDADGIPVSMSKEERMRMALKPDPIIPPVGPMICANLSAKPMLTPSGDLQYPVGPCKGMNFWTPPPNYRATQAPARKPVAEQAVEAPQQQVVTPEQQQMDLNILQMMRLGELDAMQGKPLNMQYASSLGYMKGYTRGQERRMQPASGGFGGYNR